MTHHRRLSRIFLVPVLVLFTFSFTPQSRAQPSIGPQEWAVDFHDKTPLGIIQIKRIKGTNELLITFFDGKKKTQLKFKRAQERTYGGGVNIVKSKRRKIEAWTIARPGPPSFLPTLKTSLPALAPQGIAFMLGVFQINGCEDVKLQQVISRNSFQMLRRLGPNKLDTLDATARRAKFDNKPFRKPFKRGPENPKQTQHNAIFLDFANISIPLGGRFRFQTAGGWLPRITKPDDVLVRDLTFHFYVTCMEERDKKRVSVDAMTIMWGFRQFWRSGKVPSVFSKPKAVKALDPGARKKFLTEAKIKGNAPEKNTRGVVQFAGRNWIVTRSSSK